MSFDGTYAEMGWNDVGSFDVAGTEVRVAVSDRTSGGRGRGRRGTLAAGVSRWAASVTDADVDSADVRRSSVWCRASTTLW